MRMPSFDFDATGATVRVPPPPARFAREVLAEGLPAAPSSLSSLRPVTESDLAALPPATKRWLWTVGVVGRPRDWSFRLHAHARFRTAPGAEWTPVESWQYNSALDVARLYHIRMRILGVPVLGRDLYRHGAGELSIRPLDLFTIERDRGPELDASELVTWLNDAVMLAPSMLLTDVASFAAVPGRDDAFDVTVRDRGHAVSARVTLDADDCVCDFRTEDRWYRDPRTHAFRRVPWSTPAGGWRWRYGRLLPTGGRAVWHLPEGDHAYAEFDAGPGEIAYNVPPGG